MAEMGRYPDGKLIFLINPTSGKASGQKRLAETLAALEERAEPGRVLRVLTEAPGHAAVLAEELSSKVGPHATLFICGGDGTVHEAVNGLMAAGDAALPFAVLPAGTGNDYARHLYGCTDFTRILDDMAGGRLRLSPVDVVRANGRYCANVMSFGLDTRVQMINEKLAAKAAFLGESTFVLSALAGLLGRRSFRMRLEAETLQPDGRPGRATMECRYILLAICNAEYYGGGFQPVPGADSTDGLLEICQVDTLGLPGILRLLPRYRKGTHLDHPAVHRLTVRKGTLVSLDGTVPLLGNMDGEVFTAERLEFECLPSALRAYRSAPAET
ncbi:MAG: YegS/Rv2252/BmrU family lipid kinase [Clostridia bacterium]|nr:YegS/Rv2252/BmrU family lipid kinase [Clostridia bacterium]